MSVATVEKGPKYLQLFDIPFTVYLKRILALLNDFAVCRVCFIVVVLHEYNLNVI